MPTVAELAALAESNLLKDLKKCDTIEDAVVCYLKWKRERRNSNHPSAASWIGWPNAACFAEILTRKWRRVGIRDLITACNSDPRLSRFRTTSSGTEHEEMRWHLVEEAEEYEKLTASSRERASKAVHHGLLGDRATRRRALRELARGKTKREVAEKFNVDQRILEEWVKDGKKELNQLAEEQ